MIFCSNISRYFLIVVFPDERGEEKTGKTCISFHRRLTKKKNKSIFSYRKTLVPNSHSWINYKPWGPYPSGINEKKMWVLPRESGQTSAFLLWRRGRGGGAGPAVALLLNNEHGWCLSVDTPLMASAACDIFDPWDFSVLSLSLSWHGTGVELCIWINDSLIVRKQL